MIGVKKMAEIWAVSTNKGGVLKTSITTNLGAVFSQMGKKVLIIDTDNQGNSSVSFGINPDKLERTLYDVLVDGFDPKESIINVHKNIDILPSNDDMGFFEIDVLSDRDKYPKPFYLLRDAFKNFDFNQYDLVLIDCPPNIGLTTGNVFCFADKVLVPFQPESYSMRSLVKILNAIKSFKENHNPKLEVLGVVATLVDSRASLHAIILPECRKFCLKQNIKMFETVIPKSIRFANSVAMDKLPATLVDKKHPLVKSYFQLYEEVVNNG
jgi:chromosome partitioning protein